jgi:aquaporin Z
MFWVAPILGAIIGAVLSEAFFAAPQETIRKAMAKD